MFTDMVGYTSMAQKNETQAVELLEEHRDFLRPILQRYKGRIIDTVGDAFLVEFASAVDSVNCAVEIQTSLNELNGKRPEERKILLRIGIHLGDVIHKGEGVMGDAVNVASRIEPLASPGGICVTQQVFDNIRNKVEFSIVPFGAHDLKHVELPVNIYTVILPWEEKEAQSSSDLDTFEAETIGEERDLAGAPRFTSGIEALDEILGGGYPSRSTILIVGSAGIGKEALGYWFTYSGLDQNDFCIYLSRLSAREVLHDIRGFGVDFSKRVPLWYAGDGGQIKLNMNDLAGISTNIREIARKNSNRRLRIVADVTSSLLMLNPPEVMYKFFSQLFSELKNYDSALIATLEEGMHPSNVLAAMEQLFDGVIELKLYEEGPSITPLLRIRKMRGMPPQPIYFSFSFTRNGMEISEFGR
jgi:KaiC/GvpD/RAD55 family RecA-like ATPase